MPAINIGKKPPDPAVQARKTVMINARLDMELVAKMDAYCKAHEEGNRSELLREAVTVYLSGHSCDACKVKAKDKVCLTCKTVNPEYAVYCKECGAKF